MRYNVEIIQRFKNAHGMALGYAELVGNAALYKGGILRNEAMTAPREQQDCTADLFPSEEIPFAEMILDVPGIGKLSFTTSEKDFAPPTYLHLSRSKQTTITIIDSGNENEIVENFGTKSWVIDIRGILVDLDTHQYPSDKVKQLAALFNINDVIDVSCPLLNDLGIMSLWLEDQTIEPVEGYQDTAKYTLRAHSILAPQYTLIV